MAGATDALRDLQPFLDGVEELVVAHALGPPGGYARWTRPNASGPRDLGLNPYGCADAVNLLYTLGSLPRCSEERSAWIDTLQSLQDPHDGLFREATHHPIHTTAHCVAALELLDALVAHEVSAEDLVSRARAAGLAGYPRIALGDLSDVAAALERGRSPQRRGEISRTADAALRALHELSEVAAQPAAREELRRRFSALLESEPQ